MHYKGRKDLVGVRRDHPANRRICITFYGTAVVRQFEMMGVYSLNESVAITRSRDKLRALQAPVAQGHRPARHGLREFARGDTADLLNLAEVARPS